MREECLRFGENRNYGVNGSPERGSFGCVLKKGARDREGSHLIDRRERELLPLPLKTKCTKLL